MILEDDPEAMARKTQTAQNMSRIVSTFERNGNRYLTLRPHPYFTIDLTNRYNKRVYNEGWTPNSTISITARYIRGVVKGMATFIHGFYQIPQLFYYNNKRELVVNQELANKHITIISCGQKQIRLQYAVVTDEDHPNEVYEGCIFMINSYENFAMLTLDELDALYYHLSTNSLPQLGIQMLTYERISGARQHPEMEYQVLPKSEGQLRMDMENQRFQQEQNQRPPESGFIGMEDISLPL